MNLIAELYLKNISDINTALDDFVEMYSQVKLEEASLAEKLEVEVSFDESAIDEIIKQAIRTDQEAGSLALQLAKRLEYGLKLVKDRSGIERFVINDEHFICHRYWRGIKPHPTRNKPEFFENLHFRHFTLFQFCNFLHVLSRILSLRA